MLFKKKNVVFILVLLCCLFELVMPSLINWNSSIQIQVMKSNLSTVKTKTKQKKICSPLKKMNCFLANLLAINIYEITIRLIKWKILVYQNMLYKCPLILLFELLFCMFLLMHVILLLLCHHLTTHQSYNEFCLVQWNLFQCKNLTSPPPYNSNPHKIFILLLLYLW